jgi:hypothetical protein
MFAPIVFLIRRVLGVQRFTHIRAKVIEIHSNIIIHASGWMGLNHQQQIELLHIARENGRKLGFLI